MLSLNKMQSTNDISNFIHQTANDLGFCLCGITSAAPIPELEHLNEAIAADLIAGMKWLAKDPRGRCNPNSLLKDAKSVICVAYPYKDSGIEGMEVPLSPSPAKGGGFPSPTEGRGRLMRATYLKARFARGRDYHEVVRTKLEILWDKISKGYLQNTPKHNAKICVDTSPILEKALAMRARLGFIGKNSLLVNKQFGSWFVLGEIITTLELNAESAYSVNNNEDKDPCAGCNLCVETCPTGAITSARQINANRCISYLTIEHKGLVPDEFRQYIIEEGQYGCDVCQEVCPYNRKLL